MPSWTNQGSLKGAAGNNAFTTVNDTKTLAAVGSTVSVTLNAPTGWLSAGAYCQLGSLGVVLITAIAGLVATVQTIAGNGAAAAGGSIANGMTLAPSGAPGTNGTNGVNGLRGSLFLGGFANAAALPAITNTESGTKVGDFALTQDTSSMYSIV